MAHLIMPIAGFRVRVPEFRAVALGMGFKDP